MRLSFTSGLDPKLFLVNKRFLTNTAIPPEVKRAMDDLAEEAQLYMLEQNPGWRQRTTDYYIVALDFTITDRRTDVDGPGKRVLDAVCRGAGIFDSRVQELFLRRFHGTVPGITVTITQCREADYDVREYRMHREGKIDAVHEASQF